MDGKVQDEPQRVRCDRMTYLRNLQADLGGWCSIGQAFFFRPCICTDSSLDLFIYTCSFIHLHHPLYNTPLPSS